MGRLSTICPVVRRDPRVRNTTVYPDLQAPGRFVAQLDSGRVIQHHDICQLVQLLYDAGVRVSRLSVGDWRDGHIVLDAVQRSTLFVEMRRLEHNARK
jgi:hypothetical protein